MEIAYPSNCRTNKDKLEFLYSAQEKLRLEHNEMGRKLREGEIIKEQWEDYLKTFKPKNYTLSCQIALIRDAVMKSLLEIKNLNPLNEDERIIIHDRVLAKKKEFQQSTKWNIDLKELWL